MMPATVVNVVGVLIVSAAGAVFGAACLPALADLVLAWKHRRMNAWWHRGLRCYATKRAEKPLEKADEQTGGFGSLCDKGLA